MLQLEELKQALLAQQPKIQDLREALGCDRLLEEKKKLDEEAASPDFWNDMENTRRVLKEQKVVNEKLDSYNSLVSMFEDARRWWSWRAKKNLAARRSRRPFCGTSATTSRRSTPASRRRSSRRYCPGSLTPTTHPDLPRGRGRHRGPGLGADALPHVRPLVGAPPLQGQGAGLSGRGGSGHQERVDPHHRHQRLRLFEVGERRPPAGAHLAV